jgi:hypothetical protein
MSVNEWATLIVAVLSILGSVAIGIKWLVKHYLAELKPNSGSSLKDQVVRVEEQVGRLEERVDEIYFLLVNAKRRPKK